MANFYLTAKLPSYLLRLDREYATNGNALHQSIIQNSRSVAIAETAYDNLDGGTYGHDARLYLPLDIHSTIPLKQLNRVAELICNDLNELTRQVSNEFFRAVVLEVDDENDPDFQRAIAFSERSPRNPETLSFWKAGHVRLFVSHRDGHKKGANQLAEALESYGISSFVAHDTIKPLTEWRHEIIKGLETMEMMLVYLTDDFEESIWTQQEVGFAIGKGIPVISLKLEKRDPPGFIGNVQAQKGSISDPAACAQSIYKLIADELGAKERLHDGLVSAFVRSEDFNHARYRFDRMSANVETLTPAQLESIIKGYRTNANLFNAFYLSNQADRLVKYLKRATGVQYVIDGVDLKAQHADDLDDDIPF